MRLLLVDPPPPFDAYRRAVVAAPFCPSLTLAVLGGAAKDAGHQVRILDLRLTDQPDAALREELTSFRPNVVGFTCFTFTYQTTLRLAAEARQVLPDALFLLGGVHAQVVSEDELHASPFDALVLGEGEQTLKEILAGRPLEQIDGLLVRRGSDIIRTGRRELAADLDELGFPAYELFDLRRYARASELWKSKRVVMLETSRGCPFHCSFCTSHLVFGDRWRAKSASRVMAEIHRFLDLGFEEIHIQDDGFTTDLTRAKEICRRILTCGRRFPWELYNGIRADLADEEFIELAARSGCYRIRFGIESGSQEVLNANCKRLRLDQVPRVFAWARKYGMETAALFILGLPEETPATMEATTEFALGLPCDFARVSVLSPYPGSAIYERWKSEGRILAENWDDYHFHSVGKLVYRHPQLSGEEIQRAYRRFYRRFYLRPSYLFERVRLGLRRGTMWRDIRYFGVKFLWDRRPAREAI